MLIVADSSPLVALALCDGLKRSYCHWETSISNTSDIFTGQSCFCLFGKHGDNWWETRTR